MFVFKCNRTKTKYGKANDVKAIIDEFGDYRILEMKISKERDKTNVETNS